MNDDSDEELQDCLTALGMLVQKQVEGAGNMVSNDGTASQRLACRLENVLEGQVI